MIEEPPVLTIAGADKRRRPTAAQIAAITGTPTGFVVDAMDGVGALSHRIKPLPGLPMQICGPALTCDSGPADVLALVAAMTEVAPGDVLVNATGGWDGCAALGDRVCGMARNGGAVGIVTDGLSRDLAGIRDIGLPVFCAGISPNSPHGKGPGSVGLPISIGGLPVASGDMIVGDEDGVVVIPNDRIDAVIDRLDAIRVLEADLDAQVAGGRRTMAWVEDLLASDAVRRL